MQDKQFYNPDELAALLGINVATVYRWIKSGKLKAHRIGRKFHVKKEDFDCTLKRSTTK